MNEFASDLRPLTSPEPSTYTLGDRAFTIGEQLPLTEPETAQMSALAELFRAVRETLDRLYHDLHAATKPWNPALHAAYHRYVRMFAHYQRAYQDLTWALQDRIGAALPLTINLTSEAPGVFVRAASREDAPSLSVVDVATLCAFKSRAEEPRALAMALNDAFRVEDGVPVEFALKDWDAFGMPFFTTRTPAGLTDPANRGETIAVLLNRMLEAGRIGQSLLLRSQADPARAEMRMMPTLLVAVTDETAYVGSFVDFRGQPPTSELTQTRRMLTAIGPARIRSFLFVRHLRVLPNEALQDAPEAPKRSGFIVTRVDASPRQCASYLLPFEPSRDGSGLVCRLHGAGRPGVVLGTTLIADDLLSLLDPPSV